jgi:hypothetical protein
VNLIELATVAKFASVKSAKLNFRCKFALPRSVGREGTGIDTPMNGQYSLVVIDNRSIWVDGNSDSAAIGTWKSENGTSRLGIIIILGLNIMADSHGRPASPIGRDNGGTTDLLRLSGYVTMSRTLMKASSISPSNDRVQERLISPPSWKGERARRWRFVTPFVPFWNRGQIVWLAQSSSETCKREMQKS